MIAHYQRLDQTGRDSPVQIRVSCSPRRTETLMPDCPRHKTKFCSSHHWKSRRKQTVCCWSF